MKQTAVEWLLDQLENQVSDDGKQTMSLKVTGFLLEQAKEMEKQQIIDAHINGQSEYDKGAYRKEVEDNSEYYYNETFNKDNKNKCFECNEDKNENELYCSFCRSQI